jgi:hypothetical protein
MSEPRKLRVFLCHAPQDTPVVRELYRRFLAGGWIDPWLDEEKLLPGQDRNLEIDKAIESAGAVIVFLSTASVTKEGYVQKEMRHIMDLAMQKPEGATFVLPLRLDDCDLPRSLRAYQHVDYFPESQRKQSLKRLLESLKLRAESLNLDRGWKSNMAVHINAGGLSDENELEELTLDSLNAIRTKFEKDGWKFTDDSQANAVLESGNINSSHSPVPKKGPKPSAGGEPFSILFLAADPTDAARLRLGEEQREIQEKLQLAKQRDRFNLQQRMSVRPVDISQALLDVQPRIVHFSGHGLSTGELCFEDQSGKMLPIRPAALAALFEQFSQQVECVILNACFSETQAQAIGKHIQYVVGMSREIGDRAAISFAVGFYQALGAGRSIEDAYKLGCVQIQLYGIEEHLTPVLLKKGA